MVYFWTNILKSRDSFLFGYLTLVTLGFLAVDEPLGGGAKSALLFKDIEWSAK